MTRLSAPSLENGPGRTPCLLHSDTASVTQNASLRTALVSSSARILSLFLLGLVLSLGLPIGSDMYGAVHLGSAMKLDVAEGSSSLQS